MSLPGVSGSTLLESNPDGVDQITLNVGDSYAWGLLNAFGNSSTDI